MKFHFKFFLVLVISCCAVLSYTTSQNAKVSFQGKDATSVEAVSGSKKISRRALRNRRKRVRSSAKTVRRKPNFLKALKWLVATPLLLVAVPVVILVSVVGLNFILPFVANYFMAILKFTPIGGIVSLAIMGYCGYHVFDSVRGDLVEDESSMLVEYV